MSMLVQIADRVLNRPLLVTPEKAQIILSVLAGRIGIASPEASRFEGDPAERDESGRAIRWKPYNVKDGVAIITVTGSLVNRGAWIGASSGLTSYEGIGHQLKTAAADPAVQAAILDLATPGGEATGAFEAAELVRALASAKPTVALVNGMAASAGYALASGAREVVTTATGVSGSIGVVMLHADFSRSLANEGITPTLIFAGAHKVDGNPFEPLPASVREELQAEVSAFYELFLSTVAAGRGHRLTTEGARATEARCLIGQAAVDAGLADRVGSFESVLAELSRAAARPTQTPPTGTSRRTEMDDHMISRAEHDTAVRAAEGRGREAATARLVAALGAEGVSGDAARMAAALELAAKSPAMSGEDIAAYVTAHGPAAKGTPDAEAYERQRLADAGLAAPKPASGADTLGRIMGNYRGATGQPKSA